jgi:carbamoyltransferase
MSAILGINAVYHESAAALVMDGALVAACEEERFSRCKHGKEARVDNADQLPDQAIAACLAMGGIDPADLDAVALSFSPATRAARFAVDPLCVEGDWGSRSGEDRFRSCLAATPAAVRRALGAGFRGRIVEVSHHRAHAASTFYPSGFDEAAVLVVDGIAEDAASAVFDGHDGRLYDLETIGYPHSIGFLWEKLSCYLGFGEHDACKTMGLAAYGDPERFRDAMAILFPIDAAGGYRIDPEIARFRLPEFGALETLFGPRRNRGGEFRAHHYDVAAALQESTSTAMVGLARRAIRITGRDRLCLAGGVALNCVANAAINACGEFADLYIPSAPHDAGTAIGAALELAQAQSRSRRLVVTQSPFLGPEFGDGEYCEALNGECGMPLGWDELYEAVVDLICAGKVVGWFQGRVEFGPRALGNRSLLADPRRADMRQILNRKVKHREDFRPFAPSVLAEEAGRWFEVGRLTSSHAYMLYTVPSHPERAHEIPAVLHVDGTARVQLVDRHSNPRYHALISAFARRTGVPLLLNTSFNDSEPIVCSPSDALATFANTAIDAVVLGNRLLLREALAIAV